MNETEKNKLFPFQAPGELEQLTELHKAMGDYTRMRILWYLMQKDSCVSELAQKMEVTESAISHQLRALRIVRLVQSRKAGKNVIYSLQDEHIRWILEETYAHISEKIKTQPLCCFCRGLRGYSITAFRRKPTGSSGMRCLLKRLGSPVPSSE